MLKAPYLYFHQLVKSAPPRPASACCVGAALDPPVEVREARLLRKQEPPSFLSFFLSACLSFFSFSSFLSLDYRKRNCKSSEPKRCLRNTKVRVGLVREHVVEVDVLLGEEHVILVQVDDLSIAELRGPENICPPQKSVFSK